MGSLLGYSNYNRKKPGKAKIYIIAHFRMFNENCAVVIMPFETKDSATVLSPAGQNESEAKYSYSFRMRSRYINRQPVRCGLRNHKMIEWITRSEQFLSLRSDRGTARSGYGSKQVMMRFLSAGRLVLASISLTLNKWWCNLASPEG